MSLSAIALSRELIRFNTVNPPGNERPCAEHLARLLDDAGFHVELIPFGDARAQLVASIGGQADHPPLAFTGHIDTVPLGAQPWSVDPFSGVIDGDKLFGRGASDMKSGVAAFVAASVQLAGRLAGTPGVLLVVTAGEETGCSGAEMLAGTGKLQRAGALVVAEPTGNKPLVGHKGALWLEAETRGVTAHGSMPDKGVNAVYKAARAVSALEQFDFNVARHPILGAPTLNVGTIQGGLNINSVPDRAVVGIDIRTIPSQTNARTCEHLASYLGQDVKLRTLIDMESVWTDPDDPWIGEVFEIAHNIAHTECEAAGAPYFTDACALKPALGSPPTVILGPGEIVLAHQTDEYCLTTRIDQATEIYSQLIENWCRRSLS
ncbi:MAG: M20 family metallopeptidase [Rhizobiales bacterium]|nr:M20 family metallopeptidase [Hyphomicrobiales bacterium]